VIDSKCVTRKSIKESSSNKVEIVDAEKYKIEEATKKGEPEKKVAAEEPIKKKKPSWKKENLDWLKIFEQVMC
jgi:hypothetical protein